MPTPIYIEYGEYDENLDRQDNIVDASKNAYRLKQQGHARVVLFNESDSHDTDWCAEVVIGENGMAELQHFNEASKMQYESDYQAFIAQLADLLQF